MSENLTQRAIGQCGVNILPFVAPVDHASFFSMHRMCVGNAYPLQSTLDVVFGGAGACMESVDRLRDMIDAFIQGDNMGAEEAQRVRGARGEEGTEGSEGESQDRSVKLAEEITKSFHVLHLTGIWTYEQLDEYEEVVGINRLARQVWLRAECILFSKPTPLSVHPALLRLRDQMLDMIIHVQTDPRNTIEECEIWLRGLRHCIAQKVEQMILSGEINRYLEPTSQGSQGSQATPTPYVRDTSRYVAHTMKPICVAWMKFAIKMKIIHFLDTPEQDHLVGNEMGTMSYVDSYMFLDLLIHHLEHPIPSAYPLCVEVMWMFVRYEMARMFKDVCGIQPPLPRGYSRTPMLAMIERCQRSWCLQSGTLFMLGSIFPVEMNAELKSLAGTLFVQRRKAHFFDEVLQMMIARGLVVPQTFTDK